MATMIEEEAQHLVNDLLESLKSSSALVRDDTRSDEKILKNDGRIYQLESDSSCKNRKSCRSADLNCNDEDEIKTTAGIGSLKIEDVYVKPETYKEVGKSEEFSESIVQMSDAFGVPILNTIWRMMAGKRLKII